MPFFNADPHQTLADVALRLNANLDLEKLLEHTVNAASVLVDIEASFILMLDENNLDLIVKAHYNYNHHIAAPKLRFPLYESLPGEIYRKEKGIAVPENATLRQFTPDLYAKTLIFYPMFSRKEVIGLLAIYDTRTQRSLTHYESSLMQQLAKHAGIAIENARIYEDSQQRSFELALIIDAAEAVNSTLTLSHVIKLIGKNVLTAIEATCTEIVLHDSVTHSLRSLSAERLAAWGLEARITIAFSALEQLNASLMRKEPSLITATLGDTIESRQFFEYIPRQAIIPIYSDDSLHGVIALADPATTPLGAQVQLPANRLVMEYSSQEPRKLGGLARQLMKALDASGCRVWKKDDEDNTLQLILDQGTYIWNTPQQPCLAIDEFPSLEATIHRQSVRAYNRHDACPQDIGRLMDIKGWRMLLIVPFAVQDGQVGMVLIGDTLRDEAFKSRQISLAQALVLQAANAMKNAQLFSSLQNSLNELRQTQTKLVQTARLGAVGELAAAVAHQINNPLTTILGDAELLLTELPEHDPTLESIEAIHRAGKRAHAVVHSLLSISRSKSNDPADDLLQPIDVNSSIQTVLTLIKGTLLQNGIQLSVAFEDNLPPILGYVGQLEDVWLNLLVNARDAVRQAKQPEIAIQTSYDTVNRVVVISFADNGYGFNEDDIDKVFDAFYTTKASGEGTGLGLYTCKDIVEQIKGTITPANRSDSHGAIVTVTLPSEVKA